MFRNKKEVDTPLDLSIKKVNEELKDSATQIRMRTYKVLKKNLALTCYTEGTPDYSKAADDLAKAKYSLLCEIGHYDGLRRDYNELTHKEGQRITTEYYHNEVDASHEVVEYACRNWNSGRYV